MGGARAGAGAEEEPAREGSPESMPELLDASGSDMDEDAAAEPPAGRDEPASLRGGRTRQARLPQPLLWLIYAAVVARAPQANMWRVAFALPRAALTRC